MVCEMKYESIWMKNKVDVLLLIATFHRFHERMQDLLPCLTEPLLLRQANSTTDYDGYPI